MRVLTTAARVGMGIVVGVALLTSLHDLDAQGMDPAPAASATTTGGCGQTPESRGPLPAWTAGVRQAGLAGIPFVVSNEGNLVGVLFGAPLHARPTADGRPNKILWIARAPRDGRPLHITASLASADRPVTATTPANARPGEIYPSIVDVTAPGCWHVTAEWNGNVATLDLSYD